MSEIKNDSGDIILNADGSGNDVVFSSPDGNTLTVGPDGVATTVGTSADVDAGPKNTLITKDFASPYNHSHTNIVTLDAITASYTTTEESKLTGIETGATRDFSQAELDAKYLDAEYFNSTYKASLSTATGLGTSNALVSSQNAIKVYNDGKPTSHQSSYHSEVRGAWWAIQSSQQWIERNALTVVTWNSIYNNNDGNFSLTNDSYNCTVGGYYRAVGILSWAGHTYYANERIDLYILKSGSARSQTLHIFPIQGAYLVSQTVFWEGWISSGESLTLYAKLTSTYSGNNTQGTYGWTAFCGHRVSYR